MPIIGNITPTNVNIDGQPISVTETNPITIPSSAPVSSFVTTIGHTVPASQYAIVTPMGAWFEVSGNRFGFDPADYTFSTGGGSGPFDVSLMTNLTDNDLFVEALFVSGGLSSADWVALFAGNLNDVTRPVGEVGVFNAVAMEGVNEFKYIMAGGGAAKTHDSHIFRLPSGHTLRRSIRHGGPGDVTIDARVWSETIIKGKMTFPAGTVLDGDKFLVELYNV